LASRESDTPHLRAADCPTHATLAAKRRIILPNRYNGHTRTFVAAGAVKMPIPIVRKGIALELRQSFGSKFLRSFDPLLNPSELVFPGNHI
jgi:hypothetical protein